MKLLNTYCIEVASNGSCFWCFLQESLLIHVHVFVYPITLRCSGLTITVLERHLGCQALGSRIDISPSGKFVLVAHGLGDILSKKNIRENVTDLRRYENGPILTTTGTQNVEDIDRSP
jgi:hypothetical protein